MDSGRSRNTWATKLRADPTAPGDARTFVRSAVEPLAQADRLDLVALLTSELVSNAVRHGPAGADTIRVTVSVLSPRDLRVEVADPGPGFDPGDPAPERGFGLRLVGALSRRWGVERLPEGTSVWFEL